MALRLRSDVSPLKLHEVAKTLRTGLGWSVNEMATKIGISASSWERLERAHMGFSQAILDSVREKTGFDLWVLAYCIHGDTSKFPPRIQQLIEVLRAELMILLRGPRHKLPGW